MKFNKKWSCYLTTTLLSSALIFSACQQTSPVSLTNNQDSGLGFKAQNIVANFTPSAIYIKETKSFSVQEYLNPGTRYYYPGIPPLEFSHGGSSVGVPIGPPSGSGSYGAFISAGTVYRNSFTNLVSSDFIEAHVHSVDNNPTLRKSLTLTSRFRLPGVTPDNPPKTPMNNYERIKDEGPACRGTVTYHGASNEDQRYEDDLQIEANSASITFQASSPTTSSKELTVTGNAHVKISFSGSGPKTVVMAGDPMSASTDLNIPVTFIAQIECPHPNPNPIHGITHYYYDSFEDVPSEYPINSYKCAGVCPPQQARSLDDPSQCVNACAEGYTTSDHGKSGCFPIPTPDPCNNTTVICGGNPGPSGSPPGNGGGSGGDGNGGDGPGDGPSPGPTPDPNSTPTPTPAPTPTSTPPGPTPTPSGGGGECKLEDGYRKLGNDCVFCPQEFGLSEAQGCHLNLDLKVEHFKESDNQKDPPPVMFSPRDVNGQFDQLNIQVKGKGGHTGSHRVRWDLSINKKNSATKIWEHTGLGEEPITYDGWSEDQGKKACLVDGQYEVNLNPSKRVYSQSIGRDVVLDTVTVTPQRGEFTVDNTPSVIKDLLIVQDPKQPQPEDQIKTTISFTIKEPLVNQISGGLHPDMFLSGAGDQWLSIEIDDEPLFVDEPFMIASLLPRSYYTINKVDDRTATVAFTVDGPAYGRSMLLTLTDALGNQSKQIFWLKAD